MEQSQSVDNAQSVEQSQSVDNAQTSDWRDSLLPEYQAEPLIANFKDQNGLVKSYVAAQKLLGTKHMSIPSSPDDVDGWNSVYEKLGRPQEPSKYELSRGEEIPSEYLPDEAIESWKGIFHKAGLNDQQAKILFGAYHDSLKSSLAETHKEYTPEDATSIMKSRWGNNYEQNLASFQRAYNSEMGQKLAGMLANAGLSNSPEAVDILSQIGSMLQEGKSPLASASQGARAAQTQINTLRNNPDFMSKYLNQDPNALATLTNLYKAAAQQ